MNRLSTVTLGLAILVASTASAQTRIESGETVSGSLTPGDSRMYNGAHFEVWIFSGSRGERIAITLRSIQFDPYLLVQPFPGGRSPIIARDDDSGGGNDAQVEVTLPEDGDYVITATSAQRGETGAYRLSVESIPGVARASRARAAPAAAAKPLAASKPAAPAERRLVPGETVTGVLVSSPRGPLGTTEGDWRYAGHAGETITLDLRSSEFDPFLTLYSVGSTVTRVAQDDNGGGGLNSRIVYRLPADGEYVARAERRLPGRSGSYTLSFSSRSGLLPASRGTGNRTLAAGSAVAGELDGSDPKMRDGTPYELWTYMGRSGETIRITLRSDDFDAFVSIGTVNNGVFTALESADDGAGATDSRLEITLPFTGRYSIRANSLSPRRPNGDYALRIDSLR